MRCQSGQLPPHRFGVCVCGIVARLGLEPTVDRVTREWTSALRAMESDFYITAMASIWYTLTYTEDTVDATDAFRDGFWYETMHARTRVRMLYPCPCREIIRK